ncbi:hypothetical protein BJY04DRAFT_54164 [Aspergillus karnatakaensis]|uniref:F-box protein n=1 Tax=Aspergillus karnatakaensis TaxID=1810916 RepID=UPI003CCC957D
MAKRSRSEAIGQAEATITRKHTRLEETQPRIQSPRNCKKRAYKSTQTDTEAATENAHSSKRPRLIATIELRAKKTEPVRLNPLDHLNHDVMTHVMSFLGADDIVRLQRVDRNWNTFAKNSTEKLGSANGRQYWDPEGLAARPVPVTDKVFKHHPPRSTTPNGDEQRLDPPVLSPRLYISAMDTWRGRQAPVRVRITG